VLREEAVAKRFQELGGRLIGWYLTFGHHDWLAIGEFPDEKARLRGKQPILPHYLLLVFL
jgi:uncharacterized protein with GYD domain